MIEHPCPYCHKPMIDRAANRKLVALLDEAGVHTRVFNPGGAEFHHPTLGRKQVSAMCDHCDLESVRKWLGAGDG